MTVLMDYIATLTMIQFAFTCLIVMCATVIVCFFLRCFWKK